MKLSEAEQRTVYEWLYEDDLKGRDWKLMPCVDKRGKPTAPVSQYDAGGRTFAKPLPPLDMNLAFSECVPKLKREGVGVWFASWNGWCIEGDTETWGDTDDFYAALLEYIKAVRP